MAKPFKGVINVDVTESVPDWGPYTQPIAARGHAQRGLHRPRRRGLLGHGAVRRPDRDAEHQPDRRSRPRLHELPHDRAVLADALVPDDRPQPHHERHGHDHRGGIGLPELQRPHPVRVRDDRRGARRARLEHVHDRQVAPDARGRDEPRVAQGPVADRPRLRALLRVPRRRDQPVVSGSGLRQPPGRAALAARGGLPPHRRTSPTRRSRSSRTRRRSRPTSRSSSTTARAPATRRTTRRRSGPTSTRASSTWATRPTASSCSSARRSSASSPSRPSCRRSIRTSTRRARTEARTGPRLDTRAALGLAVRRRDSGSSRGWPRSTPGSSATPITRSGGCSTTSRRPASSTTRSSCSSPTTAPRARADRTDRSTRTSIFNGLPDTDRGEPARTSTSSAARATYNHYPTGWACAFNTPFKLWKRYATGRAARPTR